MPSIRTRLRLALEKTTVNLWRNTALPLRGSGGSASTSRLVANYAALNSRQLGQPLLLIPRSWYFFQHPQHSFAQWVNQLLEHYPHKLKICIEIMVRRLIAHPGNVAPLNSRVSLSPLSQQVFGGFTNDFDALNNGSTHDFIGH